MPASASRKQNRSSHPDVIAKRMRYEQQSLEQSQPIPMPFHDLPSSTGDVLFRDSSSKPSVQSEGQQITAILEGSQAVSLPSHTDAVAASVCSDVTSWDASSCFESAASKQTCQDMQLDLNPASSFSSSFPSTVDKDSTSASVSPLHAVLCDGTDIFADWPLPLLNQFESDESFQYYQLVRRQVCLEYCSSEDTDVVHKVRIRKALEALCTSKANPQPSMAIRKTIITGTADVNVSRQLGANDVPDSFTPQQLKAVQNSHQPFSIVQGPPGTGKTRTGIAIIRNWIASHGVSFRLQRAGILITSHSHCALEDFAVKLLRESIPFVFLTAPRNRALLGYQLKGSCINTDALIREASVYFATSVAIGKPADKCCYADLTFPLVLFDEAAQSSEAVTLVPLAKGPLFESKLFPSL
jgi:hypothetical protein